MIVCSQISELGGGKRTIRKVDKIVPKDGKRGRAVNEQLKEKEVAGAS